MYHKSFKNYKTAEIEHKTLSDMHNQQSGFASGSQSQHNKLKQDKANPFSVRFSK